MKNLLNSVPNLVLGVAMLASAPLAACGQESELLNDLRSASAAVDTQVATDLVSEFEAARSVPHPARTRRAPTVVVADVGPDAQAEMYVVVVEASRLPALNSVTAQVAAAAPARL